MYTVMVAGPPKFLKIWISLYGLRDSGGEHKKRPARRPYSDIYIFSNFGIIFNTLMFSYVFSANVAHLIALREMNRLVKK